MNRVHAKLSRVHHVHADFTLMLTQKIAKKDLMSDGDSDLDVRRPAKAARPTTQEQAVPSGLVHGHAVKEMLDKSRAARDQLLTAGEEHGGGAAPIHRVSGRIVSQEEWKQERDKQDPRYHKQRQRELDKEFEKSAKHEWKQGLEQSSERMAKAEEALLISSEPISRSRLRDDYEDELRRKERWDDPLSRARAKTHPEISEFAKPQCKFQAPPNRFNIQPGYRWDGVVRGNDFEARWFERSNEMKSKRGSYRR